MVKINGSVGKVQALFDYISELQIEYVMYQTEEHQPKRMRKDEETSTPQNDYESTVEFPLLLPIEDNNRLHSLLEDFRTYATHQDLSLEWNYSTIEDTLFASLKLYSKGQTRHWIAEKEVLIMASAFKGGQTCTISNDDELFVAIIYAIEKCFVNVSNVKLAPSADNKSLRLVFDLSFCMRPEHKNRATNLMTALSQKMTIKHDILAAMDVIKTEPDTDYGQNQLSAISTNEESSISVSRPKIPAKRQASGKAKDQSKASHEINTTNSSNDNGSSSSSAAANNEFVLPKRESLPFAGVPSDITIPSSYFASSLKGTSISDFYDYLQPPVSNLVLTEYTTPRITATLSPFQTQNVEWMVKREAHMANENGAIVPDMSIYSKVPFPYTGKHITKDTGQYKHLLTNEEREDRAAISRLTSHYYRGGILADEMGLGKTVSVLALIAKHTYNPNDILHPKQEDLHDLVFSKGTLIVAPGSIINQWVAEIKKHAPSLQYFVYEDRRSQADTTSEELAKYDIVLAYYEAFKVEVHFARDLPKRPRRSNVNYQGKLKKSPLVSILWFRCILDEAQMIEGKTSTATALAKLIPSWYSWGVTGTPMKNDYIDLYNLYDFTNITCITKRYSLFRELCHDPRNKPLLFEFARHTMRRNAKDKLEGQIQIPKQTRHIVRIPFSVIEQHYYDDLWNTCRETLRLNWLDTMSWAMPDSTREETRTKLRSWLVSLRQACIHPSMIANHLFRLTTTPATNIRTIQPLGDVLHDMGRNARNTLDSTEYHYYTLLLKKGGMYEVLKDWEEAINIYTTCLPNVERISQQHLEISRLHQSRKAAPESSEGSKADAQMLKMGVKWRLLLHRYYFYMAGVYHALGDDYAGQESLFYSKASTLRQELLENYMGRVKMYTEEVHKSSKQIKQDDSYTYGPRVLESSFIEQLMYEDDPNPEYGERTQKQEDINVLKNTENIGLILDRQYAKILYLRDKILPILSKSLMDSENTDEVTGDEYEQSLEEQEMCEVYLTAYQALLQDRKFIIKGTFAGQSEEEVRQAKGSRALQIETVETSFRKELMSPAGFKVEHIRDVELQLRDILDRVLNTSEIPKRGNITKAIEDEIIYIQKQLPAQSKLLNDLDSDFRRLSQLFNSRVAYYKYLQSISDTLLEWKSSDPEDDLENIETQRIKLEETIAQNKARDAYFQTLIEEQEAVQEGKNIEPKMCLMCMEPIEKGIITYCGHSACIDCGQQWFRASRRCHACNSPVKPNEWYNVSYKQMEIHPKGQTSEASSSTLTNNTSHITPRNEEEDKEFRKTTSEIRGTPIIKGNGAKLDSIIQHIKYIKLKNNGKCVVFSQWKKALAVLQEGLKKNNIQCTTVERKGGVYRKKNKDIVNRFQNDPDINVILLHSNSQSSGLTLVAAQTVFIVEPVLNESAEKQAISRIHRIGQTKETQVFWYLVQDTIEERIHAIHDIKRNHKTNSDEEEENQRKTLDGSEAVSDDDLRRCFTADLDYALRR